MTVTKRIEFDAGHRLVGHEGQCRFLHGHRYAAEITVSAPELDAVGRIIDFGAIKELIGEWIRTHWDHNILLNRADPLLEVIDVLETYDYRLDIFNGKPPFVLDDNPTAEVMAKHLYEVSQALLPRDITVMQVRIYETPSAWADYGIS